jgi:2-polyprenyl-3-methyl-5-hydroxy-6-metoxy-1,4-benzoquinol methylase
MISTDKAWEKFGKIDPYFGVLADERFAADKIDENRDEFFATGRSSVAHILGRYGEHFGGLRCERALDFGCGVGRLTFPLAREFASVVGLDVSPSMLLEAESNAERLGVSNVQFALADDQLSNAPGGFDFVNSYIVLQHIPVRRGLAILSRLVDKVRPGGGFHVHFSMRTDSLASRSVWWASHHIPGVKIWQNLQCGRRWNSPAMQMNNYPLNRVVAQLADQGITDFFFSTEQHAKFLTCSLLGKQPESIHG